MLISRNKSCYKMWNKLESIMCFENYPVSLYITQNSIPSRNFWDNIRKNLVKPFEIGLDIQKLFLVSGYRTGKKYDLEPFLSVLIPTLVVIFFTFSIAYISCIH